MGRVDRPGLGLNSTVASADNEAMRLAQALALCLFGLLGCEGAPGGTTAAHGEVKFESAAQTFSIQYLSPPWVETRIESQRLGLEIPASIFGVEFEGSPPTHLVEVSHADAPGGIDDVVVADDGLSGDTELGTDTEGFAGLGTDAMLPDGVGESIPDYLLNLDLSSPHQVALAELNYLVDAQSAQVDSSTVAFEGADGVVGVVWQVQIPPGFYVRSFYLPAKPTVLRVTFGSLFDLQTDDIDRMVATVRVGNQAQP